MKLFIFIADERKMLSFVVDLHLKNVNIESVVYYRDSRVFNSLLSFDFDKTFWNEGFLQVSVSTVPLK